ncbi:MAG: hypothetical protein GVY30_00225 [Chloroflexi bacterium]|nr:hypothetical protein [Chloroflexota bacterium]
MAAVQDDGAPTLTSMEPAPPGAFWLAAVRLQAGQPVTWQDIVDLRFLNAGVIGGSMIALGANYITIGDDYPDLTGEWMQIGTQGDNWVGCRDVDTEVYGTTAVKAENGIGMLLEDVAGVVDRALLTWGGNYEIPMVIRRCDGDTGALDVMSIDWNGDISVLAGSLIMAAGETVDTVDVSEHTHDGSAGDAPALPFLNLSDTPSIYTGQAGKIATVNPTEDGLIFDDGGGGGGAESGITFQAKYWTIDGPLAAADEVGGVWRVAENFIISTITIYLRDAGDTGNTIIDVERSDDGGQTWTSLFPTSPKPTLPGGQLDRRASAIPDTALVFQNDLLRVNIDNVATADPGYGARGLSVQIDGEVHQMTPTTYVVTLTTADTEYSQALPTGVRAVSFRARDGSTEVRFAWETGKVATPTDPYQTLQPGREYFKENIIAASETLYLASSTAGTEVEIEVWA